MCGIIIAFNKLLIILLYSYIDIEQKYFVLLKILNFENFYGKKNYVEMKGILFWRCQFILIVYILYIWRENNPGS